MEKKIYGGGSTKKKNMYGGQRKKNVGGVGEKIIMLLSHFMATPPHINFFAAPPHIIIFFHSAPRI